MGFFETRGDDGLVFRGTVLVACSGGGENKAYLLLVAIIVAVWAFRGAAADTVSIDRNKSAQRDDLLPVACPNNRKMVMRLRKPAKRHAK